MGKLTQIVDSAIRAVSGNVCLTRPITAIGTTKSAINTTAAVVHSIGGIIRNLAALTSQALVTGAEAFRVQPANTTVYYVFAVNAGGTVHTFQGRYAGEPYLSPTGMALVGDGNVPDIPDTYAPFGMVKVAMGAATFTPGTTLFDAANVTATWFDLHCLPADQRP